MEHSSHTPLGANSSWQHHSWINVLFSGVWRLGARQPWLMASLLFAVQTLFTLNARELWYSNEVRYADILHYLMEHGNWLLLSMDGAIYTDKPPFYFWLVAAASEIYGGISAAPFMLVSTLSGLLLLLATLLLGSSLGMKREELAATGMILLSSLAFAVQTHVARMDLLFSAFITLGLLSLYRGLRHERASYWTVLGFLFAALATLTKGPFGFALPFAAALAFLTWTGRPRILMRRDMLLGLTLFILVILSWVAGIWLMGGESYLQDSFARQIAGRAVRSWHHREPFYYYLFVLPMAFLPWSLLPLALPMARLLDRRFWQTLWQDRREAGGTSFLWASLLGGLTVLSMVSAKLPIYLTPLLPLLALLTARGALSLTAAGSNRFWSACAAFFLLLALAVILAGLLPIIPVPVRGLGLAGVILGLLGLAILRLRNYGGGQCMAVSAVGITILSIVATAVSAPSLNPIMSPKNLGETLGDYMRRGYALEMYKVAEGTLSYYVGAPIPRAHSLDELSEAINEHEKVVVLLPDSDWHKWQDHPKALREVQHHRLAERIYTLAILDNPVGYGVVRQ